MKRPPVDETMRDLAEIAFVDAQHALHPEHGLDGSFNQIASRTGIPVNTLHRCRHPDIHLPPDTWAPMLREFKDIHAKTVARKSKA